MTSSIDAGVLESATGRGVRVAVLDSGVDTAHPELGGASISCWTLAAVPGRGWRVVVDSAGDSFGHGTAVASIVRAFAPEAAIHSVRVLGIDLRTSSERILAALDWAIDQKFDVINCSFGSSDVRFLEGYKRVVDRAFCANAILVSACDNFDARRIELPGWFPTVVSADHGALEALQFERRAGEMVEFVARGRSLRLPSRQGSYKVVTGSSFAAPHLSALVARIREHRPTWNAVQVKAALYHLAQRQPAEEIAG